MSLPLSELQIKFLSSVISGDEPQGLAPDSRFGVYSRAYRIRLIESLEEDFPETLAGLPDPQKILMNYIQEHPSSFWTVGEFGKYFPAYIRKTFPGKKDLAFLADLEWARWVAISIGTPEIPVPPSPGKEIVILVNPSLQIVSDEEKSFFVFHSGNELREERASREDIQLIEDSRAGRIVSELGESDDVLINFVTRWSTAGVIIGFKEIA